METPAVLLIIAMIIAFMGLIVGIIGLVLIETKYKTSPPWWVQLMIWGGLALFIIGLVIAAFMWASIYSTKKKKKRGMNRDEYSSDDYCGMEDTKETEIRSGRGNYYNKSKVIRVPEEEEEYEYVKRPNKRQVNEKRASYRDKPKTEVTYVTRNSTRKAPKKEVVIIQEDSEDEPYRQKKKVVYMEEPRKNLKVSESKRDKTVAKYEKPIKVKNIEISQTDFSESE